MRLLLEGDFNSNVEQVHEHWMCLKTSQWSPEQKLRKLIDFPHFDKFDTHLQEIC